MSSAEYIAIAAGLMGVWQSSEMIQSWFAQHIQHLLFALSVPL